MKHIATVSVLRACGHYDNIRWYPNSIDPRKQEYYLTTICRECAHLKRKFGLLPETPIPKHSS
jgi:hypothetical protein